MTLKKLLQTFVMPALLLLWTQAAFSQNKTVTGKVTDSKDATGIPGVTVLVKGTSIGTKTDVNGAFTLSAPAPANTLVISAVGYNSQELSITDGEMSITLEASAAAALNEVVVVGYGTAR